MAKSIRPKVDGYSLGVVVEGMKELGAGKFGKFPDSMLGDSGLMVCTDSTEGNGLLR